MKGYQLPPVMFTAEEATSLFVGGELVKQYTDASLHTPMVSALDKLRAVLPRDRQDHIEKLTQRTLVYGRPDQGVPEAAGQRWLLPSSKERRATTRVVHGLSRARTRDRYAARVEPLGRWFFMVVPGIWSRGAGCEKDYRHFRVDRIRQLELRSDKFEAREGFRWRNT